MNSKILIIRLGAIGDVVHSTIIQLAIKRKHPDTEIHFLSSDICTPLLNNDPNLCKVHSLDTSRKSDFFYLCTLGISLRTEKYDVIINLSNSLRNLFLTTLASPGKIVFRNKNRTHAVDAFFNSAQEVFADIEKPEELKLHTSSEATAFIENEIRGHERPFIVINPGGETDYLRQGRIWSLEYWAELSDKLVQKYGGTIFIVGSKQEKEYHRELCLLYRLPIPPKRPMTPIRENLH